MKRQEKHLTEIQMQQVKDAIGDLLVALGADPHNEGLKETPDRVARMYDEILEGMRFTNEEIAQMFNKCFDEPSAKDLVLIKDINAFSLCEHHLALMYNMKIHVAYIPEGRVIGLSKIPRIVDLVCKRLQLQERIGSDIADILEMILQSHNVAVIIEGEHACMTTRGIKKPGAITRTSIMRGLFDKNPTLRSEVYELIRG